MEMHNYTGPMVPRRDRDFAIWLRVFSSTIAMDAARYMVAPAEAEVLVHWSNEFDKALAAAQGKQSRNPVTVLEKCQVRNSCEQLFRGVAARIKVNDGISNADKVRLNIRPKRLSWSAVPQPMSSPVLWTVHPVNGGHLMQYRDDYDFAASPSKAKPYGVLRMEMRLALTVPERGEEPLLDSPTEVLSVTKTPFIIWHDHKDDGKMMTCWGRWVTRTNKYGPWGAPASCRIAFAGSSGTSASDWKIEPGVERAVDYAVERALPKRALAA